MGIEEVLRKNVPTITFDKLIGTPIAQVLSAMDEYAKQEAMAYQSFFEENFQWCMFRYIKKVNPAELEEWPDLDKIEFFTKDQIYEQYLLHKQNKEQ